MSKITRVGQPNSSGRPPERHYHVFSLQRSGHHAVMDWLQACLLKGGHSSIHFNHVYHGHLSDSQEVDPMPAEILRGAAGYAALLLNYEDLAYGNRRDAPQYTDLHRTPSRTATDVIVVRDLFTLIASRLQHLGQTVQGSDGPVHDLGWDNLTRLWTEHATAGFGEDGPDSPLAISYNGWFAHQSYKVKMAGELGLPNSDASIDSVPANGNGSSFNGTTLDGSARRMNVLRRWHDLDVGRIATYKQIVTEFVTPDADRINREMFGLGAHEVLSEIADM